MTTSKARKQSGAPFNRVRKGLGGGESGCDEVRRTSRYQGKGHNSGSEMSNQQNSTSKGKTEKDRAHGGNGEVPLFRSPKKSKTKESTSSWQPRNIERHATFDGERKKLGRGP